MPHDDAPLPLAPVTRVAPLPDRFAVLADIHGNADALAAVLKDVAQAGQVAEVGAVLLLGDHFSGPLDAAGTADQLLALSASDLRVHALRGNHDRYLLEQSPEAMGPSDRVAHAQLPRAAMDWLATLPAALDFGDVGACHATPRADDIYWTHAPNSAGGVSPRPLSEIAAGAGGLEASLLLCAHTHLPGLWRLPSGQLLVNPGSVGCPAYDDVTPVPHVVEAGHPLASWALVTRHAHGWQIDQRHVPYDPSRMAAAARAHGRESWARAVTLGHL